MEFTETQHLIRGTVRDFAEKELRTHAIELDENGSFPSDLFRKMAGLGLTGIPFPEKYVVPNASGRKIGAYGLTEPNAGSDASATQTTAKKTKGGYILNGSKMFV